MNRETQFPVVYLMHHSKKYMKVGIAKTTRRIEDHLKNGWEVLDLFPATDYDKCRAVEQDILELWMELNEAASDQASMTDDDYWWALSVWGGVSDPRPSMAMVINIQTGQVTKELIKPDPTEPKLKGGYSETIQFHEYYYEPTREYCRKTLP